MKKLDETEVWYALLIIFDLVKYDYSKNISQTAKRCGYSSTQRFRKAWDLFYEDHTIIETKRGKELANKKKWSKYIKTKGFSKLLEGKRKEIKSYIKKLTPKKLQEEKEKAITFLNEYTEKKLLDKTKKKVKPNVMEEIEHDLDSTFNP